jgi:hypothetical protein
MHWRNPISWIECLPRIGKGDESISIVPGLSEFDVSGPLARGNEGRKDGRKRGVD